MRLGIVVGEGETWQFLSDLYDDLRAHFQVEVFERRRVRAPVFYYRLDRFVFERDLRQFMARNDVVFFEWASEHLARATMLPKTCRIITRLHRYELFEWSAKINWDAVDQIILVSHALEKQFHARFPAHAHKTVVIPVGVSLTRFQPAPKPFHGDLGILCHLIPRKRVYDLILDFAELVQTGHPFHLHIGGAPHVLYKDYAEALKRLVENLKLADKVTFYGQVQDTPSWYQHIDIFVSNSYSEGLQVAPMEAMASGRYCLSHHWDGAEELLPSDCLYYTSAEFQQRILAYYHLSSVDKQRQQARMRALACEHFELGKIQTQVRQVIYKCARSEFLK